MSIKVIGNSGYVADVDSDGTLKVTIVKGAMSTESVLVTNAGGAAAINIQDGGNSLTVDGTVAISNLPSTQTVAGTVSISNFPGVQTIVGALTDTQLRASAVSVNVGNAISISNFPATQAVSLATQPLPTGAATQATLIDGTQKTQVTNFPATQPVSGSVTVSNLLATQPISATALPLPTGAAQDSTLSGVTSSLGTDGTGAPIITGTGVRGWLRGIYEKLAATLAVSITNWPASIPVTLASQPLPTGASTEATLTSLLSVQTSGAQKAICNGTSTCMDAMVNPTDCQDTMGLNMMWNGTGWDRIRGDINNGLIVTRNQDTGRSLIIIGATAVAGVTTEALLTLTKYTNGVAGTAATSIAVSAGKILRIMSMNVTERNTSAAAGAVQIRLRMNPTGASLLTSPVQCSALASTSVAVTGQGGQSFTNFPEGIELSGTMQISISQLAVAAANQFDIQLIGYEY